MTKQEKKQIKLQRRTTALDRAIQLSATSKKPILKLAKEIEKYLVKGN